MTWWHAQARATVGRSIGLGSVVGTAGWVSLGTLDAYTGEGGPVRVAMLPPAWMCVALVVAATVVVASLIGGIAGRPGRDPDATSPLAPLSGLAVLLLPYTPWLPDVFPILTVFAGPGRWVVWLVVTAETARRLLRTTSWARVSVSHRVLLTGVFILGALASGLGGATLTRTSVFPGGDEPHYLVMAQSLGRDRDLAIENNHTRGDYLEYYRSDRPLAPHYLTRGVDEEIYSVHPVGLPLLLAPVYAAGGYTAVWIGLALVAAATGTLLVAWLLRLGLPASAAVFAWVAVYASPPFFFFSFTVYPEMTAGLVVLTALLILEGRREAGSLAGRMQRGFHHGLLGWVAVGAAAGWLPWLSSKYAPLAAAVLLVAVGRLWWPGRRPVALTRVWKPMLALLAPFASSGLVWLGFFAVYWGTPWPGAPYGGDPQTDPSRLPVGLPGLLFDQEYGVLPYAPVYALAVIGGLAMWRSGERGPRRAGELALMVLALLGTVGAFHIWWGGSSPPGRPVVSVLPLLGVPLAWLYASAGQMSRMRGLARVLAGVGGGVTLLLSVAEEGLLLVNQRDGSSTLLAYLSPVWPLPMMFPTLIGDVPTVAYRAIAVWVGIGLATVWLLARPARPLGAVLLRTAVAVVALVGLSLAVPAATGRSGRTSGLDDRARIGLLDRFDATRRPTALAYDPWRRVTPQELVRLPSLVVAPPAEPSSSTANELLYGRRLSLPAGVYEVEVVPSATRRVPTTGTVGVMVGRYGAPFARWDVTLDRSGGSTHTFRLDVDAGYAGLTASPEIARAEPTIVLRATEVTDAHRRLEHDQVAATLRTPRATVYFLDWYVWPEARAFWIRAERTVRFLVTPPATAGSATPGAEAPASGATARLRVRCGPVVNGVTVTSPRGRERFEVEAGGRALVVVGAASEIIPVEMRTSSGFVPAEIDPRSGDRRDLGCRVDRVEWISETDPSTE